MLLGASSRSPEIERPASPKYSERLSPSVNAYLSEASRHEIRVIVPTLSRFHPQFFFPLTTMYSRYIHFAYQIWPYSGHLALIAHKHAGLLGLP